MKKQLTSILIVEDDEDDIFTLKEGFDELNYKEVCFCTTAMAASDILESTGEESLPALIVTDFNLPSVNGFEFVQSIKNDRRFANIKVAVLTTSMSVINKDLFLKEGVSDVIIKPRTYKEAKEVATTLKDLATR